MKNINWHLISYTKDSPAMNMAIDEAIFRLYSDNHRDTIRFYGWVPSAVSIGRHQSVQTEISCDNLNKFGFHLVRRISGGGAVFHDQYGELTYSIITDQNNITNKSLESSYYELAQMILDPLVKLGLRIDFAQIHCPSVFSGGKKISGNAQARDKNTILQHGTILVNYDPEIMYSVLKARPGIPQEKMIQSVYQHVTTLSELLSLDLTPESVADIIQKSLLSSVNVVNSSLTENEIKLADDLFSNKYSQDSWNYSK